MTETIRKNPSFFETADMREYTVDDIHQHMPQKEREKIARLIWVTRTGSTPYTNSS